MTAWHSSYFNKRVEYTIKPLEYSNVLYNIPIILRLDSLLGSYINSVYDVAFVIDDVYVKYYDIDISNLEFCIVIPVIHNTSFINIFVYYDINSVEYLPYGGEYDLKLYTFDRNYVCYNCHPGNHNDLVYTYYNPYELKHTNLTTSIDYRYNYGDYFCYFVATQFYVPQDKEGEWWFAVDGDDVVEVEIDGNVVASWYGGHGACNCIDHNGSIVLTEGWHNLVARHEESRGGQRLSVYFKFPSDTHWYLFSNNKIRCFRVDIPDDYAKSRRFVVDGYSDVLLGYLIYTLPNLYVFNKLDTLTLDSVIGPDFTNNGAALGQPVCDHIGVLTDKVQSSYISVSVKTTSSYSIMFFGKLIEGGGLSRLVTFNTSDYIIVQDDGSLILHISDINYQIGYKIDFNTCFSFSVTCDGSNLNIIYNGVVIYYLNKVISISDIYLGGYTLNTSSTCNFYIFMQFGYVDAYYIDYLHNTMFGNNVNIAGYDDISYNVKLSYWPTSVITNEPMLFLVDGIGNDKFSLYDRTQGKFIVSDEPIGNIVSYTYEHSGIHNLHLTFGVISKFYNIKVNDSTDDYTDISVYSSFNDVSFQGNVDILSNVLFLDPTINGYMFIFTEYSLPDFNGYIINIPIDYYMYSDIYNHIIDTYVEFYIDVELDSYYYDVLNHLNFAYLTEQYKLDIDCYLFISSYNPHTYDTPVYFESAYWKYFDYPFNTIVSDMLIYDTEYDVTTQSGILHRIKSDVYVSDQIYYDFDSSIITADEQYDDYGYDVSTISGALNRFESEIILSVFDELDYSFNVKLNTIVFDNFSVGLYDTVNYVDCYSVDVYDEFYGIDEPSIKVYIYGTTISGVVTSPITNGYKVNWCHSIFNDDSEDVYVFIVEAKNNYGDTGLQSFYLRRGRRYTYNPYHIKVHDYNELIPILITAENDTEIYPAFTAENLFVNIENMPYRGLMATITPVALNRGDVGASITALSPNFYPGGHYEIRISCKDNEGNVMPEFVFDFTIRDDGL